MQLAPADLQCIRHQPSQLARHSVKAIEIDPIPIGVSELPGLLGPKQPHPIVAPRAQTQD